MTDDNTRSLGARRNGAVDRVATGVKTALLVCAVGFVALVANRALVSPAASAGDAPALPAAIVSTPAAPVADYALPQPAAAGDGAAQSEGGDNHPPTF